MNISEYKNYLTEAIAVEANFTSDDVREMDTSDKYMQDAWRDHGQLLDDAQRKDALRTALAEYRSYDKAGQLSTVFLIDLVHAARPQEEFV